MLEAEDDNEQADHEEYLRLLKQQEEEEEKLRRFDRLLDIIEKQGQKWYS